MDTPTYKHYPRGVLARLDKLEVGYQHGIAFDDKSINTIRTKASRLRTQYGVDKWFKYEACEGDAGEPLIYVWRVK